MFNMYQPQRSSYGAEYNVPASGIRGPGNTVNINSGQDDPNRNDAFSAFSRLFMPALQNQASMLTGMNARPIDPATGAPIPGAPQQYGQQDFQNTLSRMFGQVEDEGLVRDFFNMPSFNRMPPTLYR